MRRLGASLLALALLALVPVRGEAAAPASCGVAEPTRVFTGEFGTDVEGAYVLVPFDVPAAADATRVRVRLCHDGIEFPNPVTKHTLDLGLYQPSGDGFWDREEFRGWGGSSRLDVTLTPEQATLGFVPGPVPAGTWAAEIGVAAVAGPDEGDPDATVAWRLEVKVEHRDADLDTPWTPAPYDATPRGGPGWYQGDFHVHAEHSNPVGATMQETFDYAFGPAGLDFVTLSDYVTTRHWDEIGRFQGQPAFADKLVIRSAEVITYRGHVNNHASVDWADYRTGTIYERQPDGTLVQRRGPVPPGAAGSGVFDDVHAHGGWTQVNHPTIFPSDIPAFGNLCRGCSWEYSDAETDWSKVDAFEVQTGPAGTPHQDGAPVETDGLLGPNPFTPAAVEWWDRLQRSGFDITAVGSSDSHDAGHQELTQSPIGEATTVVYAEELSEQGVGDAVRAGHTYVKFFGAAGPDLRLTAVPIGGGRQAMMGDELAAAGTGATFTAQVLGDSPRPGPLTLLVLRDGLPYLAVPVTSDPFTFSFPAVVAGDYRLQLMRGTAIEALTNPVNLVPAAPAPPHGHGGKPSEPGPPPQAPAHGRRR